MTNMTTSPAVVSGSTSGCSTRWATCIGVAPGWWTSTGVGLVSSLGCGTAACVGLSFFFPTSWLRSPRKFEIRSSMPPPANSRAERIFCSMLYWYTGKFCASFVTCWPTNAPMPSMTVNANATTRTTAGSLGNPQLRSSRTAGASKNVSRIARANGRKTALAKYSAAITPNTANTVMDRAIATSLRMPRVS